MTKKRPSMVIKNVRCNYPTLAEPKGYLGNEPNRYSITMLIPKDDKDLVKEIRDFYTNGLNKFPDWSNTKKASLLKKTNDTDPYNTKCLLKDGDKLFAKKKESEEYTIEAYKGHWILAANLNELYGIPLYQDGQKNNIPPAKVGSVIRAGYRVNVAVDLNIYDVSEPGVALYLRGVQFVKADEPLCQIDPFELLDALENDIEEDDVFSDDEEETK